MDANNYKEAILGFSSPLVVELEAKANAEADRMERNAGRYFRNAIAMKKFSEQKVPAIDEERIRQLIDDPDRHGAFFRSLKCVIPATQD